MSKIIVGLILGVLVTVGTLQVFAGSHGETEVRVNVRTLADGRVEVSVQQRDGDGWSERQLPTRRFLPADSQPRAWRSSSSVSVAAPAAVEDPDDVYCLVTHAHPDDDFWVAFETGAKRWDVYHDGVSVVVKHGATGERQAELVRECIDLGVDAIGSSLADPEALRDALLAADAAGIPVVTFNSGLSDFVSVNSRRHVSVNEIAAGAIAGELFVEAGIEGRVLCLIHEERNIGLVERCDGLDIAYENGEIERLYVTGVRDLPATTQEIVERLNSTESQPVAAILSLNTEVGLAALEAVEQTGSDTKLATFDRNKEALQAIVDGKILFSVGTYSFAQAWFALSNMLYLERTEPRFRQLYKVDNVLPVIGHVPILIGPQIYNAETAADWISIQDGSRTGGSDVEIE